MHRHHSSFIIHHYAVSSFPSFVFVALVCIVVCSLPRLPKINPECLLGTPVYKRFNYLTMDPKDFLEVSLQWCTWLLAFGFVFCEVPHHTHTHTHTCTHSLAAPTARCSPSFVLSRVQITFEFEYSFPQTVEVCSAGCTFLCPDSFSSSCCFALGLCSLLLTLSSFHFPNGP